MSKKSHDHRTTVCSDKHLRAAGMHLQEPHVPVLVHDQVEAEQLEAGGQREEAQLARHRFQALACVSACLTLFS